MLKKYKYVELKKLFLVLFSALLYTQSYPANNYALLVWVALVPWLMALDRHKNTANIILSFLFAMIIYLLYLWTPFYNAAFVISHGIILATLFTFFHLFSYMIPFIVLGMVYKYFDSYTLRDAFYLATIFSFVCLSIPTLFTFNLGVHLYEYPLLLQVLDISGISLLLWLIVVVNIMLKNLLFLSWDRAFNRDFLHNIIAIFLIFFFVLVYGSWHLYLKNSPSNGTITIATIQPNMGHKLSQLSMIRDQKGEAYSHIELSRKALAQNNEIDLIVWPEGGLIVDCNHKIISKKLNEFTREIDTPIMYQCNDCTLQNKSETCYNQSRYIGANGEIEAMYNKQNLIPLFEHVPKVFRHLVVEELHSELLFEQGEKTEIFSTNKAKIIPAVCYDAHATSIIEKGVSLKGQLLVIQSNNSIFQESAIGLFDTAINITNTISFRLPMVKSCNSGYGVFTSAFGEIFTNSLTPVNERYVSVNTINLEEIFSLYRMYGDWFYVVMFLSLLYHYLSSRKYF